MRTNRWTRRKSRTSPEACSSSVDETASFGEVRDTCKCKSLQISREPRLARQVVKARGESMAAAAQLGEPHGMLSVIGLADADLQVTGVYLTSCPTVLHED